ncbi:T9SS type A sorting domain-containing protein [Aquimarina sp. 2304DJ70-9]|uniref:T9SS type A sorting domain-containing protein n=1 Tax=Aquimarina penaris TaxID=3231044 RepID=UPI0034627A36
MKHVFLLAFFLASITVSAQCGTGCTISGSSVIPLNTNRVYSVPASSGFSYFWSVTGGLSIVGSNTGSSVTVRGLGSGTLYITKFKAGSAPCCASKNIVVSSNVCGLSISRVTQLNASGEDNVAFFTVPTLQSGWSVTSSTFTVTLDSGSVSTYTGSLNPNGYPQIIIPVPCVPQSGRVDKVSVSVTASSGANSCTRTVVTDFLSVCGTGGGIGIGFSIHQTKDQLSVTTNSDETFDVAVYDLNGNLKFEAKNSINTTFATKSLSNGIYIIKTSNKKGEVQTKKVIIQK